MILKLLAKVIGIEQITWVEVLLGASLSVVFYFFLIIVLSF